MLGIYLIYTMFINWWYVISCGLSIISFTYGDGNSAIWAHILNQTPIAWVIIYSNIYFNYFNDTKQI
jgi:hypothetical protein